MLIRNWLTDFFVRLKASRLWKKRVVLKTGSDALRVSSALQRVRPLFQYNVSHRRKRRGKLSQAAAIIEPLEVRRLLTATQPPVGASNTVNVYDNTAYTFAAADFKFSDPNNSPANSFAAVEITSLPEYGAITDNGSDVSAGQFVSVSDINAGHLVYTPWPSSSTYFDDSFTFQVQSNGSTDDGGVNVDPDPQTMTLNVEPVPPTVATPAAASADTVTGTTDDLSVLGDDSEGESSLTYTWSTTSKPSGSDPTFSDNDSNDAKNTTVTFNATGDYTFLATITNSEGASVTSSVDVTVSSLTGGCEPPVGASNTVNVYDNSTYTFSAADFNFSDPNNSPANSLAAVEITTLPDDGEITNNGTAVTEGQFVSVSDLNAGHLVYTAWSGSSTYYDDSFTFQVQSTGSTSGGGENVDPTPRTMTLNVEPAPPSVATAAAADASPVTGTTVNLSVLGDDSEGESSLTYTWSVTSQPSGASPTFSDNDSNDAKNATVTFNKAGSYTFLATITNSEGASVTSSVNVSVTQTPSSLSVTPSSPLLAAGETEQFSVTADDQFGHALSSLSGLSWSVDGDGTINSTGLYTAPDETTSDTVTATDGGASASVTVSVTASPPTVDELSTSSGTSAGGTSVTITGSNFTDDSSVKFGDTSATSVTVNNDGSITAVSPAESAGSVNVTVTTPNGTSDLSSSDSFTFVDPAPVVTSLSSTSGSPAGGNSVTITGSHFTDATDVKFGSDSASSFTVENSTTIVAVAPAESAGTVDITVLNGSQTSATSSADRYTYAAITEPPVGSAGSINVTDSTPYTFSAADFPFSDPDNSPAHSFAAVEITTLPDQGTITDNGTDVTEGQFISVSDLNAGKLVYTPWPTSSTYYDDSFTFQVQSNGSTDDGGVNVDPTAQTMTINLAPDLPSVATAASADAAPVTGTSVDLSVLGADPLGESTLTYSWTATSAPSGADPYITDSGSNDAKNTTVDFDTAGDYTFEVTITNSQGASVTSSVDVTVDQTISSISMSPSSVDLSGGETQQFTATGYDQFGHTMSSIPGGVSWSVSGEGTISSTGLYTAPYDNTTDDVSVDASAVGSSDGSASATVSVSVPAPSITEVSASSGTSFGGTSVTISGSNFTDVSSVMFGDVAATSFTVNNSGSITAIAPPETVTMPPELGGTVDLTVTTPGGTSTTSSADQFTYVIPVPTVTSLSETSSSIIGGDTITITGTNFTNAAEVMFGDNISPYLTIVDDTTITAVVPTAAAGTVDVTVTNGEATSATSSADQFTYWTPDPIVAYLSSTGGSTDGGNSVTISGNFFDGATAVDFGSVAATSFVVNNDGTITATVPAETAGTVDISVTTPAGTSASGFADEYSYYDTPTITGLSATVGPIAGGTIVTISGTNLLGLTSINFGSVEVTTFSQMTGTSVTVISPAMSTTGEVDVTVTNPAATSATSSADQFSYQPLTQAPVGTANTVTTTENVGYVFQASDFGFTDPHNSPANTLAAVEITTLPASGTLYDEHSPVTAGQFIPLSDLSSGQLVFAPDKTATANATASFTFQVQSTGSTAGGGVNVDATARTMTIDITAVAQTPVGTSKTVNMLDDRPYTFSTSDFGFTEPSVLNSSYVLQAVEITTLPTAGTLTDNGTAVTAGQFISASDLNNQDLVFTPASGASGADYAQFTFQVQDNGGTASGRVDTDPTAKTITINAETTPVGTSTTLITTIGSPYTFSTSDFGLVEPSGESYSLAAVKITASTPSGTLTDDGVTVTAGQWVSAADIGDGLLVYTPATGLTGTTYDLFAFQVQDTGGTADGRVDTDPTAKVMFLTVAPVNLAPTGTSGTVTTSLDTDYTFGTSDFGFTDPNPSPANSLLAVEITTLPAAGTLTDNGTAVTAGQFVSASDIADSLLVFTPASGASGSDYASFTFQVEDSGSTLNSGVTVDPTPRTLTVDVNAVVDAPVITSPITFAQAAADSSGSDSSATVNAGLTITDDTNSTLASATVTITNDVSSEDVLAFTAVPVATGNISGSFDATSGVLTLTSAGAKATLAQWEAALRTVTYTDTSSDPDLTPRQITFAVDNGQATNSTSNSFTTKVLTGPSTPTFNASSDDLALNADAGVGDSLGVLLASDVNPSDTLTFSLSGSGSDQFAIDSQTGEVTYTGGTLTTDDSYSLTATVTNQSGTSSSAAVDITVLAPGASGATGSQPLSLPGGLGGVNFIPSPTTSFSPGSSWSAGTTTTSLSGTYAVGVVLGNANAIASGSQSLTDTLTMTGSPGSDWTSTEVLTWTYDISASDTPGDTVGHSGGYTETVYTSFDAPTGETTTSTSFSSEEDYSDSETESESDGTLTDSASGSFSISGTIVNTTATSSTSGGGYDSFTETDSGGDTESGTFTDPINGGTDTDSQSGSGSYSDSESESDSWTEDVYGNWTQTSGSASASGTGMDSESDSGMGTYIEAISGGSESGSAQESQSESNFSSYTITDIYTPGSGWTLSGTASDSGGGSNSESYGDSETESVTISSGDETDSASGTGSDSGGESGSSSYQYGFTLEGGDWVLTSGSSSATTSGSDSSSDSESGTDIDELTGGDLSGTESGTTSGSDSSSDSFSFSESATYDPSTSQWTYSGSGSESGSGDSESSSSGSGTDVETNSDGAESGKLSDGSSQSDSDGWTLQFMLSASGAWTTTGSGSGTDSESSSDSLSDTGSFSDPVDGGSVGGGDTDSTSDSTSGSDSYDFTWNDSAGGWVLTSGSGSYTESDSTSDSNSGSGTESMSGEMTDDYGDDDGTWTATGTVSEGGSDSTSGSGESDYEVIDGSWVDVSDTSNESFQGSGSESDSTSGTFTEGALTGSFSESESSSDGYSGSDSDNASGEVSGSGEYSSSGSDIISDSYSGIMSFGGTTGMFSGGDSESDSSSGSEDFSVDSSGGWDLDDGGTEESSGSASSTESYSGSYSSGGDSATYSFTISDSVSGSDEEMTEGGGWVDESDDVSGSDSETGSDSATQTGSYITAYGIVGSFTNTEGDSSQEQDGWSNDTGDDGASTESGSGSGSDTSTDSYSYSASGSYTDGGRTGTYSESFTDGDSDTDPETMNLESDGTWDDNGSESGSGSGSATISDTWKSVVISATSGGFETTVTNGTDGDNYGDNYTDSDNLTNDVWGTASGSGSGSGFDSESTSSTTTGTYSYTFDSSAGTVYGTITGSGSGGEQDSYQDMFMLDEDGWAMSETGSGSMSSSSSQSTVGTGTYTNGPTDPITTVLSDGEILTSTNGATTTGTLSDSGNTSSNSQGSFTWGDDGWNESMSSSGSGSSTATYSYTTSGSTSTEKVTPGDPVTSTYTFTDNLTAQSGSYTSSQTNFASSETSLADGTWYTSGSTSTSTLSTDRYNNADTETYLWSSSWPAGNGASTSGSTYLQDDYWSQGSGSGEASSKLGSSNAASSDGTSDGGSWGSGASSWAYQTTWQSSVVGTGFDKEYGSPGSASDSGGGSFSYGSSGSGSGSGSGSSEQDAGVSSGSGSSSSGDGTPPPSQPASPAWSWWATTEGWSAFAGGGLSSLKTGVYNMAVGGSTKLVQGAYELGLEATDFVGVTTDALSTAAGLPMGYQEKSQLGQAKVNLDESIQQAGRRGEAVLVAPALIRSLVEYVIDGDIEKYQSNTGAIAIPVFITAAIAKMNSLEDVAPVETAAPEFPIDTWEGEGGALIDGPQMRTAPENPKLSELANSAANPNSTQYPGGPSARMKGNRMTSTDDALQQLEEIEKAQQDVRQGKGSKKIDSIEKSKQRVKNRLNQIKDLSDLEDFE